MALDPRIILGEGKPAETPLARAVAACRAQFVSVGLFSGVVNGLQLTVSLYMMQVFDRVLATRNLNTLVYLTLIAIAAVGLLAVLEAARSRIMQRVGAWVEEKVAPEGFARAVESQLRGRSYRMEALRDLGVCRGFIGSPGALALYDVPWVPVYLLVIFMLHPVLGTVALVGAVLLLGLTILNELATSKLLREANTASMATQRRADSIVRNAEVIDSMGMLPAVMARWRVGVAEMTAPMNRAMDRAAPLLAVTKFFRLAVQIAILGIGAYLVLGQELTSGASIAASICARTWSSYAGREMSRNTPTGTCDMSPGSIQARVKARLGSGSRGSWMSTCSSWTESRGTSSRPRVPEMTARSAVTSGWPSSMRSSRAWACSASRSTSNAPSLKIGQF